jgi:hypothetical protein
MNNRERLMDIMAEEKLDRLQIAELVMVRRDEVDHWLLPHGSNNHKEMPDMAVELLELKLGLKK